MASLSSPLSLYSIPVMWAISHYPSFAKAAILIKAGEHNNLIPRSNIPNLPNKKRISPEVAARLQRMDGAHLNGVENLPFFGLAVLAGNYAGIDNATLNIVSGLYLLWRLVFNYLYLNQTTKTQAALRSLTWLTSLGFPMYLLFKSAYLLHKKSESS
ncbi:hypothetical protein M413DRAFT_440373 [Hebeloma cylindrosporum]|uniref:Uncharacterized protein n=1 Tax=Hebeloma cylindrosporum TaxID=76867 RepID=A0A0C3CSD1_HEBCY|nr:hypothetical protein M413DRAFT_440373 [Hebeloma cylindrosporum h7]